MIASLAPASSVDSTGWSASAGTLVSATTSQDSAYAVSSTPGSWLTFLFPATSIGVVNLVLGVRLVLRARATVAGAKLRWAVRRGVTASHRGSALPRDGSITLTTTAADYAITFCNQPHATIQGDGQAWAADGSNFDDFAMGAYLEACDTGEVRIDQVRLEVVYRPDVELDDVLASDGVTTFQWAEIEGIPWQPCTHQLGALANDWTVGAYYWGLDARPLGGLLSSNEAFRSGRVDHAKGRIEFETARLQLLDVKHVAHEHDPDSGEPIHKTYSRGFFSWLLAYGDQSGSIGRTRLTNSSPTSNTIKGLDPKDWSLTYGRQFTVADGSVLPAGGGEGDWVWIDKECIYVGARSGNTVGNSGLLGLERGLFGSLNAPHELNHLSGIYPEVTDHPAHWAGRWVRIWINAIDTATGLPLPMSKAVARTYIWGQFSQTVGPGRAGFSVALRPFESLLEQTTPNGLKDARVKGLNFASFGLGYDQASTTAPTIAPESINYPSGPTAGYAFFDTLAALCSDITYQTAQNAGVLPAIKVYPTATGVSISAQVATAYQIRLFFSQAAADVLGFDPGSGWPPDNAAELEAGSGYANAWQIWTSKRPPASTFADRFAQRIYVESPDADDWPSVASAQIGTKIRLHLLVGEGSEEPFIGVYVSKSSDSNGDWIGLHPVGAANTLSSQLAKQSNAVASAGAPAPKCRLILSAEAVQPHEFFLPLMLSTGYGHNGTYDTLPKGFGLGIRQELVNDYSIAAASAAIPGNLRSYVLTEPVTVSELLDEELSWPTGLRAQQDNQGRQSWAFAAIPSTSDVVPALDADDLKRSSAVNVSHRGDFLVNSITAQIDYNPFTEKYRTTLQAVEPNSIQAYGSKPRQIKHRGIHSALIGADVSTQDSPYSLFQMLARIQFERFAWELPTVDAVIGTRGLALQPGDGVSVTVPTVLDVLDRDADGLVSRGCEVMKIDKNDVSGECSVSLAYDLDRKQGGYAPAGRVASFSVGSATLTLEEHAFTPSTGDKKDVDYFSVGDKVIIYEGDSESPNVLQTTITSISGNTLGFASIPAGTAVGDLVRWETWDTLTSSQQAQGYVAISASGVVDAAGDVEAWRYGT